MQEQEFLKNVRMRGGLADNDEAKHDTEVVFQTLRARISHEGGENIGAQLPSGIKDLWEVGWWERIKREFAGTEHLDLGAFIAKVAHELGTEDLGRAETVTRAVFATLREQITEGASRSVESRLPDDIREFWRESSPDRFGAPVMEGPPFEMEAPVAGEYAGVSAEEEEGARPWGPETDIPSGADVEETVEAEASYIHAEGLEVCEECGALFGISGSEEATWEESEGVRPPAVERIEIRAAEPAAPEEGPGSPTHFRSDPELEKEIRELLDSSGELDASHIDVLVRAGNVTLRGTVNTPEEREAAGTAAAHALAVGDILNEIKVE